MPAGRHRASANAPDKATVSVNERILKECHDLYIDNEKGLATIANGLDLSLLAPRKKINVLLIGNHSAGKSSFVNWYVEEHVQKTGVAIETQGFTFVTSGRKRESLMGQATLHLYPHFKELKDFSGVVEYLSTEISTSKQKKFSLVTFVDTPGLVDGDMKYPFDVDETILWLGNRADLIFVFFDPIGQALCKRTLNIVEKLNEKQPDRIRFYLSKADTAGHESDRQRVLMQITQELCKRPGLNKAGFDMQTIYVPSLTDKPAKCANQIEEVCKEIEKTINQTIQNTLNTLEKDCQNISTLIDKKLKEDGENRSYNLWARIKSFVFILLGLVMPFALILSVLTKQGETLQRLIGENMLETLHIYTTPVEKLWSSIPARYYNHFIIAIVLFSFLLLTLAKFTGRLKPTLSRKQQRVLSEKKNFVQTVVHPKREKLYKEYLQQSVAEHDL
ncbi:EH domain-containing 1-like [Paramuricea clavata]|uniref:EH domain-containing 1-like n=1 Tax=Paramuricea clavata TaxID=317549 RepID=A0A7D9DIV9_PARCT|nr:EH domain-containing 1-like [Paramuricea clavata]